MQPSQNMGHTACVLKIVVAQFCCGNSGQYKILVGSLAENQKKPLVKQLKFNRRLPPQIFHIPSQTPQSYLTINVLRLAKYLQDNGFKCQITLYHRSLAWCIRVLEVLHWSLLMLMSIIIITGILFTSSLLDMNKLRKGRIAIGIQACYPVRRDKEGKELWEIKNTSNSYEKPHVNNPSRF